MNVRIIECRTDVLEFLCNTILNNSFTTSEEKDYCEKLLEIVHSKLQEADKIDEINDKKTFVLVVDNYYYCCESDESREYLSRRLGMLDMILNRRIMN